MTGPPIQIILIPVAGSPEPLSRAKPVYPAKRCDQRWPLNQPVPKYARDPAQIEALKRRGREVLDMVRAQRAAHG